MTMARVESVRAGLLDPEPEVRRRAAQQIPALSGPESCELLLAALADEDWRVRKEAAEVATRTEPRTAVVFAIARALAERENVGLRNAAVDALVAIGPDAVPAAVDALGRLDADGRKLSVEVLAGAPTLAGIRSLAHAARDPDVNVAAAAAEGLGRADLAGEEAREVASAALSELLSSEHPQVRIAALDALEALGCDVPWSRIEPLLDDPLLRRSAIAAAGGSAAPRALLALVSAVADPAAQIARAAVVALGESLEILWGDEHALEIPERAMRASPAAQAVVRALAIGADDARVRGAALLALGLVRDPESLPVIVEALADDEVADRAEAALSLYGEDAVEPLLVAGRTAAPSVRAATLSVLPALAFTERSPVAAVREALDDPSEGVVAPALKSLAVVGTASDLKAVARHTTSRDPKVSSAAHGALLAIATRHAASAREMIRGADPRGDDALSAALIVEALARASASAPEDADWLESALTHREAVVRRAAIGALAELGGEHAESAVSVALADEEATVAHAAIRALGRLGCAELLASLAASTRDPFRVGTILRALREADPERACAAARPLLRSPETSVAAAAVEVIGGVGLEGCVDALMSATDHPDDEVVKLALGEIAKVSDERALVALASGLEQRSEVVRRCAAELLGHRGADGEGILRSRLERERSAEVRRAIMQALAVRSGATP